jgi:WD40 repeat protein/TPR repeat protein
MVQTVKHRPTRPFLGLRPFGYEDHELFFGRESQTFALYRFLDRSRFVSVVGSSGSGKSSLVRAGLLPLLDAESADSGGRLWRSIELRPGYSPLDRLADALAAFPSAGGEAGQAAEEEAGRALLEARRARVSFALRRTSFGITEALDELDVPPDLSLLILVDQFEELFRYDAAGVTQRGEKFTRDQRQEAAAKFVQLLLEASRSSSRSIHVLITMRSDFIGDCAQFYGLPEAVSASQFLVPSLTRDQREEVIRKPLETVGAEIEPALVERLLNDGGTDLDDLPVLQHCLLRLWEQAERTSDAGGGQAGEDASAISRMQLTEKQYRAIGGLSGALSHHAEEVLAQLPGRELVIEQAFRALSEVDREGRATRRALPFEQLVGESGIAEDELRRVIDRFREDDCSFLVPSYSTQAKLLPGTRIDVGHEALLRRWERISSAGGEAYRVDEQSAGWLWAEQDDGRYYAALVALVSRDRGPVTATLPLDQVKERWSWWTSRPRTRAWADRYGGKFEQVQQLFENSRAALLADQGRQRAARLAEIERFEEARRRARIYRIALVAFAVLFVCAGSLAGRVWYLNKEANEALGVANQATEMANMRLNEANLNESRYLDGLAREKLRAAEPQLAELIALSALPSDLDRPDRPVWPPAISVLAEARNADKQMAILRGHLSTVHTALFSPSGQRVITAADDGTARIWDSRTGNSLLVLSGHQGAVWSAAFSGDGNRAVTASVDRTARVWDARSGKLLVELKGHRGAVLSAMFSPDGKRILTASQDETALLWDAGSGTVVATLAGNGGPVEIARFSPDGAFIVTVALYHTNARLWDARTGKLLREFAGHSAWVRDASFSADGRRLVTASLDGLVLVWDLAGGAPPVTLRGHRKSVVSARFSADGRRIVTASEDATARVWDAATGRELVTLRGHSAAVLSADFSSDGRHIVTASADGTARLWNTADGVPIAVFRADMHAVNHATFSPDSRRVVTESQDATVRIWNADEGALLAVVHPDAGAIQSVAFASDGRRALSVSQDRAARVWNLETGTLVALLQGHQNVITDGEFSADGKEVVTASVDETAQIFDAATGVLRHRLEGHADEVIRARFSADGQRIVTASRDHTARIWDARSGKSLHELSGHEGALLDAVFSPDGRMVATASEDRTVRLWDTATGKSLRVLSGHEAPVLVVAFSPDSQRLVSASEDTTARVWRTDGAGSGRDSVQLRGHQGRVLAATFSPDGNRIATASDDSTARLWDSRTGRMFCVLSGHSGPVRSVKFNRSGDRILTASDDRTARVWDARTCATLAVLEGHARGVTDAEFSPDGERILTGSEDATMRLWKTWPLLSADAIRYAAIGTIRRFTTAERASLFSAEGGPAAPMALGASARCNALAANPIDPKKPAPGVSFDDIDVHRALPACRAALQEAPNVPSLAYQLGRVLARSGDARGAIALYQSSADKGYAAAQYALAYAWLHDKRLNGNVAAAEQLLLAAAKGGYLKSYYELGDLHWQRSGGTERAQALAIFRQGAGQGDPFSHRRLAELYARGDGVQQNFDKALLHYAIASRRLDELADVGEAQRVQEYCGALARSLAPLPVAAAARAAAVWTTSSR